MRLLPLLLALSVHTASPAAAPPTYSEKLAALEVRRASLSAALAAAPPARRDAVLGSARTLAFHAITGEIVPAWAGTPWNFYGTSETPGEGTIACGYFVSTVLRDAGFHVSRAGLAQQASERIVKTLAPRDRILRFRRTSPANVVVSVRAAQGDGLYVVGMDYHVGFLVLDGARADLCHSAFVPPRHVVCEPAETSPGFQSAYYVVGPALPDARLEDWLAGRAIPTAP